MSELTKQEKEVLERFNIALGNSKTANAIVTASFLISEIEHQFGADVMELVVGYHSGLMAGEHCMYSGEVPILSLAGNLLSDGYGEFAVEVNEVIGDLSSRLNISAFSDEAKNLASAVSAMSDATKLNWVDNYNKAVADGLIKKV